MKVIEDVFVPMAEPWQDNYCPESKLEQNIFRKSELPVSSAGIFVQRNQNIAPYFRQYSQEKRRIQMKINQEKQKIAKETREGLELQSLKNNTFNLKKWELCKILKE